MDKQSFFWHHWQTNLTLCCKPKQAFWLDIFWKSFWVFQTTLVLDLPLFCCHRGNFWRLWTKCNFHLAKLFWTQREQNLRQSHCQKAKHIPFSYKIFMPKVSNMWAKFFCAKQVGIHLRIWIETCHIFCKQLYFWNLSACLDFCGRWSTVCGFKCSKLTFWLTLITLAV